MQEITGAKPVRDANFHRRVVYGEKQTHLTQNQAALDVQVVSRRPFFKAPKAFSVMRSLGKRANSVQLRVGDPLLVAVCQHRNRASAQAGFISQLRRGQHSGLRPTFALSSYGSAGHFRAASINE
jgi:hypothetical protein